MPEGLNLDERKAVLDQALETMTQAQVPLIARGVIPTAKEAIRGGLKWRPEPPGDEHFDLLRTAMGRGWGDCDDLAPAHAASLRATGEDPEARAVVRPSGPGRWHAIVERSNGGIDDPSVWAGMGQVGGDEYRGPFWGPMFADRLSLAAHPLNDGSWAARVDVPSASLPMVYSSLARGPRPRGAVVGACRGAGLLDGDCYPEDMLRVAGVHDLLLGASPRDVHEALEQVGFLPGLSAVAPAAMSLAAPMLGKLLPGGGAPPAAAPGSSMPAGTTVHTVPGGPIIVRF